MTGFIYSIEVYPNILRVKVVADFLRSDKGHILWQIEDENGERRVVSPSSLTEIREESNTHD